MKTPIKQVSLVTALICSVNSFALSVNSASPSQLVNELIDETANDIVYSNIKYIGSPQAAGIFSGGIAEGLGIERGIILTSGWTTNASGPNNDSATSGENGLAGDLQLSGSTYDAVILEFNFVPKGDRLEFNYVFASEEYNEWVGAGFNDVFAFFLDGRNIALIPYTNTFVAIDSINKWSHANYYRDNDYPDSFWVGTSIVTPYRTEFDGFTKVLSATANVTPQKKHHIKLVIADRGDYVCDSAVFIQGKSFVSMPPAPPIPLPGTATLIPLTETTCELLPRYRWYAVANATHYLLQIKDASGKSTQKWYSASQVGCGQGTGICSAQPTSVALVFGPTQWQVRTYNSGGYGPFSAVNTFNAKGKPAPAQLLTPDDIILVDTIPTFTWEKAIAATNYLLQVEDTTGIIFETNLAPANCLDDLCVTTSTVPLTTVGSAQWRVESQGECGNVSSKMPMIVANPPPQLACQIYAVHDQDVRDSQFFTIDPVVKTSTDQGPLYHSHDIEGLDVHPATHIMYAVSGGNAERQSAQEDTISSGSTQLPVEQVATLNGDRKPLDNSDDDTQSSTKRGGTLYQVSTVGSLSALGTLQLTDGQAIDDVSGLSFNPVTYNLWGTIPNQGLFQISAEQLNADPVMASLKWSSADAYDDITWDEKGKRLYLASGKKILIYQNETITPFCTLPKTERIEALEMTSEGMLLVGLDGKDKLYTLDIALSEAIDQCVIQTVEALTIHDDVEGMAWICP